MKSSTLKPTGKRSHAKLTLNWKTPASLIAVLMLLAPQAHTQPSGGPYGPQPMDYAVPEIAGTIYYVAPDGSADASGTDIQSPTSIESAIARVVNGDAILLRGGVYRTGDLRLNQSILMQPYRDEVPIIKGTLPATEWVDQVPDAYKHRFPALWAIEWDHLFPSQPDSWWRSASAGRQTRLHKFNNDMLFIDGNMLQSTDWFEGLSEDTFYIDYEKKKIYLATDPTDRKVEITAFNRGLTISSQEEHGKAPSGKGPTIRGIHFSQYAFHILNVDGYFPEKKVDESEIGKVIVQTTLEHCSFTHAGRVGVFVFGDGFTMRHCRISDTSTEGLYVFSSSDVLLEKNIFTRNNVEQIAGYYPAAVKIFNQTRRVRCNDNLVIDLPYSNGIWYDVGNIDGVITNNWFENIGFVDGPAPNTHVWPSQNALFYEISSGATVAGNVFVNNDHGILILNASDSHVFNNTFFNSMAVFARDARGDGADHFGWHVTTGPGVDERDGHHFFNNLLIGEPSFERPLVLAWQPEAMCDRLTTPSLETLDANAYAQHSRSGAPLLMLNQKQEQSCVNPLTSVQEIRSSIAGYEDKGVQLDSYPALPLVSLPLKRFELTSMHGMGEPLPIPESAATAASMDSEVMHIGAFPVKSN